MPRGKIKSVHIWKRWKRDCPREKNPTYGGDGM